MYIYVPGLSRELEGNGNDKAYGNSHVWEFMGNVWEFCRDTVLDSIYQILTVQIFLWSINIFYHLYICTQPLMENQ